jgi:hypothetical protein
MMARGVGSLPLLLLLVSALHQPAVAQWGQRFSLAAGPAIVVQDAPPYAGVHVRAAAALLRRVRTFNLLADGYLTWLAPGTEQLIFTIGSVDRRARETQFGFGLSGLLTLPEDHGLAPYLLAGAVYRRSDATSEVTIREDTGQIFEFDVDETDDQLDLLLGLGVAIRAGARRVLVEARAYGGTTIHLPITVGMTF